MKFGLPPCCRFTRPGKEALGNVASGSRIENEFAPTNAGVTTPVRAKASKTMGSVEGLHSPSLRRDAANSDFEPGQTNSRFHHTRTAG